MTHEMKNAQIDPMPLEEEIAKLAYCCWELEGFPEASNVRLWLRAESDVRLSRGMPPAQPLEQEA